MATTTSLAPVQPYDFGLSLRAAASFAPDPPGEAAELRSAVRIGGFPTLLTLRQQRTDRPLLEAHSSLEVSVSEVRRIAGWIIFADMDLKPFYRLAGPHPILGPMIRQLHGLKPMRPAELFDMLVIAITEQQISLQAAHRIRGRLIEQYGDPVYSFRTFPTPKRLAESPVEELMSCGLSRRKAEYVGELARKVDGGEIDLAGLEKMSDEEVRHLLLQQRGLGPWSAEYFLVRGLSRPDRVPADDLGVRSVVGRYLGRGRRLSPLGVARKLSPFAPYRGLAAFYMLAHHRLTL